MFAKTATNCYVTVPLFFTMIHIILTTLSLISIGTGLYERNEYGAASGMVLACSVIAMFYLAVRYLPRKK